MKWVPIASQIPPVGACLIVTIRDSFRNRRELRYPVEYRKSYYGVGYGFYQYGAEENILMPEYSEVLAWMEMPHVWEDENEP